MFVFCFAIFKWYGIRCAGTLEVIYCELQLSEDDLVDWGIDRRRDQQVGSNETFGIIQVL